MKKLLLISILLLTSQLAYAKSPLLKLPYSLEIGKKPLQSTDDLTDKTEEEKQKSGETFHIIPNRVIYWTNERGEVTQVRFISIEKLPRVFRDIGLSLSITYGRKLKRKGTDCQKLQEILKKEEGFELKKKVGNDFNEVYTYLVDNRLEYIFECAVKKNDWGFGLFRIDISKYTDFDY